MKISMQITVDDRTYQHALKCKMYHQRFATSDNIEFHARCINDTSERCHEELRSNGFITHVVDVRGGRGSMEHAIAINQALQDVDGSCITVIADGDTAALKYGWDEDIRELHQTYDCVGIQNPDDVVRHNVRTPQQTWLGTPVPQWVSLKNGIDWTTLDARPNKQNSLKENDVSKEDERKIFGLNYSDRSLLKDTMWKLPKFLYDNNLSSFVFEGPFWNKTKESKVFFNQPDLLTEDEFQYKGIPILTHGRCCRKDTKNLFWLAIEKYTNGFSIPLVPSPIDFGI